MKADDLSDYDLTDLKSSPVGYVENDNHDLMAENSKLQLTATNNTNMSQDINVIQPNSYQIFGLRGSGALKKEDIKAGNKILLGTIVDTHKKSQPYFSQINPGYTTNNLKITFNGDTLGTISVNQAKTTSGYTVYKVYINVTNTKDYASNPTYSFYVDALGEIGNYATFNSNNMKDKVFIGNIINHKILVGNNNRYNLNIHYTQGDIYDNNRFGNNSLNLDWNPGNYYSDIVFWDFLPGHNGKNNFNQIKNDQIKPQEETLYHVFKIQSPVSKLPDKFSFSGRKLVYVIDKDGNIINSSRWIATCDKNNFAQKSDNLSAIDLLNQTNTDQVTMSKQSDGSELVAFKFDLNNLKLTEDRKSVV